MVQNTGQTSESGTTSMAGTKAFAQVFTTGESRLLTDICVEFGTLPKAKDPVYVGLWTADPNTEGTAFEPTTKLADFWWDIDNGTDGDGVCEGTGQAEFSRRLPGRNDAPVQLQGASSYAVVLWAGLNNTAVTLRTTASNAEDSGAVSGYTIEDNSLKDTTTDSAAYTWTSSTSKLKIQLYAEDTDGLRVHDAEAHEGTDMNFRLTLTPAPGNNKRLVVRYVTVEVPDERNDKGEIVKAHAKESKDYEWTSGTVTFNSGDTAKTVRVPTINDTAQDDREKFKLVASTLQYYTRSAGTWSLERQKDNPYFDTVRKRAGIGTIRNTDPVGLLSVADAEAAEEDATIDFVVTLNLAATETVTVDYATAGRTAVDGTDYTATSGTLTFEVGESTKTISVPLLDDSEQDNDKTLTLTLTNASGAELGVAEARGTIRDTKDSGAPIISGTLQVGETLTADTSSIVDSDGMDDASFTYRWYTRVRTFWRTLQNSSDATYTLRASDAGRKIIVRASFTDDAGNPEWRTSEPTAPVESAAASTNSAATGTPTISGTVQAGQTLTAATSGIADADGLDDVSYSYQWLADDADITDATASTYTLTDDDVGKTIKIRVTFTDDRDNQESLTSEGTSSVTARPNNPATGQPTISGTAQEGETLTASTSGISDADGLDDVSYSYQWLADDGDIQGADASTYTLTDDEVGKTIKVRVTFTDDRDNQESLTSATTAAVTAMPLTASVESAPASHDGTNTFTFELVFSENVKLSYRSLRDHGFQVTGGTVKKAKRLDKPSNIRWEIHVQPNGNGDVTITLPATTDCTAQGAVCTHGGKKLSGGLTLTVNGPGE